MGVGEDENSRMRRAAYYLQGIALLVSLWIIIVWYFQSTHRISPEAVLFHDRAVWAFFLFESLLLTGLADNRQRYLRQNWLNTVIIVLGLPVVLGFDLPQIQQLGSLRLILAVDLILKVFGSVRKVLSRNDLGATLLITVLLTTGAGFIIDGIDPNIKSPAEGVWWAWVTMTTVGYGDVVPASPEGRVFGVILMILGLAFSAMITAGVLAFFLSENAEKLVTLEEKELERQKRIETRLEKMEGKLDELQALLERRNPDA